MKVWEIRLLQLFFWKVELISLSRLRNSLYSKRLWKRMGTHGRPVSPKSDIDKSRRDIDPVQDQPGRYMPDSCTECIVTNVFIGPMCHASTVTRKACHRHCTQASSRGSRRKPYSSGIFRNALYHVASTFPEQLAPGLAVQRQLLSKANRDAYAGENVLRTNHKDSFAWLSWI